MGLSTSGREGNRGKTSVKAPPGRDSYDDTGGGRKQSLILGGEEEEGGGRSHTHKQKREKKKNLQFVYVHIMRVCAPGEAPQMGEVCVGFSGNRITWAHN